MRWPLPAVVAALLVASAGAAAGSRSTFPRFQPVSVAFLDARHGVLGEDDWDCQKARGCKGRLLATSNGGATWRVTFVGARGMRLYPVRGTDVVYASTGDAMLESTDAGAEWHRLAWPPAVVSFVTPALGWKLGPSRLLAQPPKLLETRDGGRRWAARTNPCTSDYGLDSGLSFASATRGWIVCSTEAGTGYQGKEVWQTGDGGVHWRLRGRTHPIAPPEPKLQLGNLPGFGYPTGAAFLADGHGWLLQDRGSMLVTTDGGRTWQRSPLTRPDTIVAQSADLLSGGLGFVLLRGCSVRLVRTGLAAASATTLDRWSSPTRC